MDSVGAAADTGTCVGRICQLWHDGGEDALALQDAISRAEAESSTTCPQANHVTAAAWATAYAGDPRNAGVVVAKRQEAEVTLSLPAPPEFAEPGGPPPDPITLIGHVDQIRRGIAGWEVWDLKSGRPTGRDMVLDYAWQLAAYAVACTETWGKPVRPGGIIRLRGYDSPGTTGVMYPVTWSLEQCRVMLDTAAYRVSELRRGIVAMTPGRQCLWCPGIDPGQCGEHIDAVLG